VSQLGLLWQLLSRQPAECRTKRLRHWMESWLSCVVNRGCLVSYVATVPTCHPLLNGDSGHLQATIVLK
jgi:hypothetical protein